MVKNFCEDKFWDFNSTWNSDIPLLTSCFENVVLISSPCIIFCLIAVISLCRLPQRASHHHLPWTWLNITKMLLAMSLICICSICCGVAIFNEHYHEDIPVSTWLSFGARLVTFVLTTIMMLQHRKSGVTSSTLLSIFWMYLAFTSIVLFRSEIMKYFVLKQKPVSQVIFICSIIYHVIVFIQFLLSVFVDTKKFDSLQNEKIMDKVSFVSTLTFIWFNRVIKIARQKLLTVADLKFFSSKFTAAYTFAAFSKNWKFETIADNKPQNLTWALLKSFWPRIVKGIFLDMVFAVMLMLPPLILDRVLEFVNDDMYAWRGYFFTILLFLVDFWSKIIQNTCINDLICSGSQLQSALMGAIFRKNFQISTEARKAYPSGALLNLFTVDVKRIEYFSWHCTTLISAPLKIILIIYIMWQYIGASTLAGFGVMFLLFPITFYVYRLSKRFSEKQMKLKDMRMKFMNEILNGIKILKLYAWEIPFSSKVSQARREEMTQIRYSQFGYVFTSFVYCCAPILVAIASFATYLFVNADHVLDPTRAFVTLTLMDQLRYALFELPDSVSELIQCSISLGRVKEFLTTENTDGNVIGDDPDPGESISVSDASLSWQKGGECVLDDINLNLRSGKLMAVIGPVGAGKSSLISSLLGETYKLKGSVDVLGSVAYVPQQAWILNRTLRQNVLLVKHMVESKYNKIIEKCCLKPDLEVLPSGDETEIGEKGVNLSGGQKQRVSLARAVYQDRDIYFLDDPLSAVDVHVRKSLFDDVIGNEGLLKKKTRILVTHDISILHRVDVIVCMKNGKIEEIGTYSDLLRKKGSFKSFIEEHSNIKVEETPAENNRNLGRYISTESNASRHSGHSECDFPSCREFESDNNNKAHRLTEDEKMEVGGVHYRIYWNYFKKMKFKFFFLALLGYTSYTMLDAGAKIWLSKWSTDTSNNGTENYTTTYRLSIYGSIGFSQVISVILANSLMVWGSTVASERYHNQMLESVIKSPMSFFDSTPMGRIVNRFSTDMDVLDMQVFYVMDGWITCLFTILSSFTIIGMNTPIFLTFLLPLGVIYYVLQRIHLNTFRQIQRLESTTRSPVYSHLLESIQGVSSICAYRIEKEFIQSFEEKVDNNMVCHLSTAFCNRWLAFWLCSMGSLIILITSVLSTSYRHELGAAVVGLIITYALNVTDALRWFVRMNTEMEDKAIAIERIDEYGRLKPEMPWDRDCDYNLPNWPVNATIAFNNYSTRYREDMDLVLKDVNLSINSSEKVGIIGRTGAGKSSITLALFRIIEAESGQILIDNQDIGELGLHKLRSKLTIIPQDPVLFSGTLRSNLDPNSEYEDDAIWASLERAHLKNFVSTLCEGLQYDLEEAGTNLSAGQRQLVCLARALLKNSKILVLDEATASVDMDTDNLIQATIRTAFSSNTVITIAHRINTIADYDKIVVLDNGCVVEVGKPSTLLEDESSKFYQMSLEAGLI